MDRILEQAAWFPTVCRLDWKSLYHDSMPITTCTATETLLTFPTTLAEHVDCCAQKTARKRGERGVFYQVCFQPDQCSELILEPHRSWQQKCKRADCCFLLRTDLLPTCSPCKVSMARAAAVTGKEAGGMRFALLTKHNMNSSDATSEIHGAKWYGSIWAVSSPLTMTLQIWEGIGNT